MDRTKKEVLKSIERFKKTGKLPKDYDVIFSAPPPEDGELNPIENVGARVPFTSDEAEILHEHMGEFLDNMTEAQKRVYDLHVIGGLTQADVARILGISSVGVQHHLELIRQKAQEMIDLHH